MSPLVLTGYFSLQTSWENDFLKSNPTLREYVQRLQAWRDRYEALLSKKAKKSSLEAVSHWLVEFQYQKFDEIEVPGQYLKVSSEVERRVNERAADLYTPS